MLGLGGGVVRYGDGDDGGVVRYGDDGGEEEL